jgi:L-threonate 2-dehydrogenase
VTAVGVIGLGAMGGAMSANLVKAGFEVRGYDLSTKQRAALKRAGGRPVASIAQLKAQILITSLPSAAALHSVSESLSAKNGIVVETSTLPIEDKERARATLKRKGITLLDCPLSGTGAQAKVKDLVVFASGDKSGFERAKTIFPGFSRSHYYVGAFGNGSRMKFVANLLVAVHNAAAAEAIVLGAKAGLDPARIVEVIASGAGTSRIFELRGPMMAAGIYTPPTATMHVLQKDSATIAEFARLLGVATPLLDAAAPLYDEADALGYGEEDVAAVHAVLARRAGVETKK